MKWNLIQNKLMLPPPPHNIILFKLDFDVKFPLLRLLQFLSDLKSTILNLCEHAFKGLKKSDKIFFSNIKITWKLKIFLAPTKYENIVTYLLSKLLKTIAKINNNNVNTKL